MKFGFLLFLLIPILGHSYVCWRLWHLLPLTPALRWLAVVLATVILFSFFILFAADQSRMPLWLSRTIYEVSTSWMVIMLYLFMIFVVLDLGRLCRLVPSSLLHSNAAMSLGLLAVMAGVLIWGNYQFRHKVRQPLQLASQGKVEKPIKIAMLSDLHLGYHIDRNEFARWVDILNAENPDLILIAGDIIDSNVYPLLAENVAQEWKRLKAPVYACLGNHEYISGVISARNFFDEAGIHLLRDTVATVGPLTIIGRDDRSNRHRKTLKELTAGMSPDTYTILLDHQPYNLEEAEQCGINFQFSGHTHYGQVTPINMLTRAMYEDAYGPWTRGNTVYYVSSGMGIWGGKFRIGTCSEYIIATIKP